MTDPAVPSPRATRLRRILFAPALHFTLAGVLLFFATGGPAAVSTPADVAAHRITVDAVRIEGLRRDYSLANHKIATEAETRALVDTMVTEEILYREAVARGFEQGDRSIAYRIAQKMRFLGEDHGDDSAELYRRGLKLGLHRSDPVVRRILVEKIRLVIARAAAEPTEEELVAWYAEHAAEYGQAGRVTLRHVFFDRDRRGAEAAKEAAAGAAVLAEKHGAEIASALGGDPFVMGSELKAQSREDLTKFFGASFADEALSLPVGSWSAPVESAFGWHLVLVEERFDARVPTLAEVHSRVLKSYENAARNRRVLEFLERTRPLYDVRIDEDAIRGGARG
jgi:parvulin-like peptidyl-prolyl isomerase